MGTSNILLGGNPVIGSIPSRRGSNTPRGASCKGNRDKLQPFGSLAFVHLYLHP